MSRAGRRSDGSEASLPGEAGGQHVLAKFVDHTETYGPRVVAQFARSLSDVKSVVDLGAGYGRDLQIIKRVHPLAKTIAVEGGRAYARDLVDKVNEVHVLDIERSTLPFADEAIDLFIANQVLEHTKEIFWIFHEVTRALRVGGRFIVGVPNIASFHNRVLMLFGSHPTQHKLCSAHVRPFSRGDTLRFLESCFPGGYTLERFAGSQFYPFPRTLAQVFARAFPSAAFSIFFLLRKNRTYAGEFAKYPSRAKLETNFWAGSFSSSQYR